MSELELYKVLFIELDKVFLMHDIALIVFYVVGKYICSMPLIKAIRTLFRNRGIPQMGGYYI